MLSAQSNLELLSTERGQTLEISTTTSRSLWLLAIRQLGQQKVKARSISRVKTSEMTSQVRNLDVELVEQTVQSERPSFKQMEQ